MPWTRDNPPDAFKSIPESELGQAVKQANAILRTCQKRGGKDCDAKAIRIVLGNRQKGDSS